MRKILFYAVILLCGSACKQNAETSQQPLADSVSIATAIDSIQPKTAAAETVTSDSVYAYIKKAWQKEDSVFIEADYIQFLTGKAAVEAAKLHHEADTIYDDKGKITDIIVDNDYYILNENKKLRTLAVGKDVTIETVSMSNGPVSIVKTSLKDFISTHGKDSFPFILKFKNNEVSKIIEVYVP